MTSDAESRAASALHQWQRQGSAELDKHFDGIAPADNLRAMEQQIHNARLELFEGGYGFLQEDSKVFERITWRS